MSEKIGHPFALQYVKKFGNNKEIYKKSAGKRNGFSALWYGYQAFYRMMALLTVVVPLSSPIMSVTDTGFLVPLRLTP